MNLPPDWNELDRHIWRAQKDKSALLPFFRSLLSAELDVLMPYQNELEGETLRIENGAPFPFALFDSPEGRYVVGFTSPERAEEGMKVGKIPPNTFLSCVVNGRELCEMVGVMKVRPGPEQKLPDGRAADERRLAARPGQWGSLADDVPGSHR